MTNSIIFPNEVSFSTYIFKNRSNRITLILTGLILISQFTLFKHYYPFANYIHGDSFSYIKAAFYNLDINTYPIGYSKFLRLLSVFSKSDYITTAFQYLLIQCSAIYLLATLFYFYEPKTTSKIILLCFIVFNPLLLHLANLISSDGIFLACSFTWFTLLLWIINRPNRNNIILHSLLLFICFTVRYNAIIYPVFSILVFCLSKLPIQKKIKGVGIFALLIGSFICFTMYRYKELTGYWQFSPFSGWQLANNAMYSYRYVEEFKRKPLPQKLTTLDKMVRIYFDSTKNFIKYPQESLKAGTVYMWTKTLPLYKYRDSLLHMTSPNAEFVKWASIAPLYKDYGLSLIKEYPSYFYLHFIIPNAAKYYAPPVEFLISYNSNTDTVSELTKVWFGYKTNKIYSNTNTPNVYILDVFPILSGIINLVFIFIAACYFSLKERRKYINFTKGVLLIIIFWVLNGGFTILASSAALRFQAFPLLLTTIYTLLIFDWMFKLMSNSNNISSFKNAFNYNEVRTDINS